MLRKIAIVGGNGFVGRHVIEQAVQRGIEALGVVRSDEGEALVRGVGGASLRVNSLEASATASLVPALSGCDGLVYTAAVTTGVKGADRTDATGLGNVLRAAREAGVRRAVVFSGLGIAHYGMNEHCTNPYFLAKMAGEVAAFRSGVPVTVFRPSYIFGLGDEFLSPLLRRMSDTSDIEIPGKGHYRLQPISVEDAARACVGAIADDDGEPHQVVDLVGPEVISYRNLLLRIVSTLKRPMAIRERPVAEALEIARADGYWGLRPHDLACLLCDETSEPAPVEALVGGSLDSVHVMIQRTVEGLRRTGVAV